MQFYTARITEPRIEITATGSGIRTHITLAQFRKMDERGDIVGVTRALKLHLASMTDADEAVVTQKPNKQMQLAMRLKAYAADHYEGGFDTFVECYTDTELLTFVGDHTRWADVLEDAKTLVSIWLDQRADAAQYLND